MLLWKKGFSIKWVRNKYEITAFNLTQPQPRSLPRFLWFIHFKAEAFCFSFAADEFYQNRSNRLTSAPLSWRHLFAMFRGTWSSLGFSQSVPNYFGAINCVSRQELWLSSGKDVLWLRWPWSVILDKDLSQLGIDFVIPLSLKDTTGP